MSFDPGPEPKAGQAWLTPSEDACFTSPRPVDERAERSSTSCFEWQRQTFDLDVDLRPVPSFSASC